MFRGLVCRPHHHKASSEGHEESLPTKVVLKPILTKLVKNLLPLRPDNKLSTSKLAGQVRGGKDMTRTTQTAGSGVDLSCLNKKHVLFDEI